MSFKRTSVVGLAAVGMTAVLANGPVWAASGAGGSWTETSTGQVSIMSLAPYGPSVTWAGGAVIGTDPAKGGGQFTPTLYRRDNAQGTAWQQVPLGADGWDSRINDIATARDGAAFLVGDQDADQAGILVGRYAGGHWQVSADTALPADAHDGTLLSVSALSGKDAWAVGFVYVGEDYTEVPLVQHWDGKAWQQVSIPGSDQWGLYQVQEVAPDDVWAVGVDYATGQSVAVHWDGATWTRTATPAFPDSAVLFDVVARSSSDVWAVGWSRDTDKQRPAGLALHWDGTAWQQVALPDGTFALNSAALLPHGGLAVVGGNDDAAVGLTWSPSAGWTSLGLPENDPDHPLGASTVVASGNHLTVSGWHYVSSDGGDTFYNGAILTK